MLGYPLIAYFIDVSTFGVSLEENILRVDRLVEKVNDKGN